jgi:hypothetical protein
MTNFDADILCELRDLQEVAIRTEKHPNTAVVIWVAVADEEVFVRSVRGTKGRWYRDLAAVLVICGEPHLVVGDIPGLDADHAAPGGVAEIGHGGGLLGPGIPHHARRGADLFDDDATAPPAILNGASPRQNFLAVRRLALYFFG